MTRIDSRDLPTPQDDARTSPVRGGTHRFGFDYAALLAARRTLVRPVSDTPSAFHQQHHPFDESSAFNAPSENFPLISKEHDRPAAESLPTAAEVAECQAIAARIANAAAPIASITLQEQHNHLGLLDILSREIATFCSDPAIANSGHWEVHVTLNDQILASTELHVSLSYFDLQLRFDTQDREARQLLLTHSVALEYELSTILRAWGQPRTVHISVW